MHGGRTAWFANNNAVQRIDGGDEIYEAESSWDTQVFIHACTSISVCVDRQVFDVCFWSDGCSWWLVSNAEIAPTAELDGIGCKEVGMDLDEHGRIRHVSVSQRCSRLHVSWKNRKECHQRRQPNRGMNRLDPHRHSWASCKLFSNEAQPAKVGRGKRKGRGQCHELFGAVFEWNHSKIKRALVCKWSRGKTVQNSLDAATLWDALPLPYHASAGTLQLPLRRVAGVEAVVALAPPLSCSSHFRKCLVCFTHFVTLFCPCPFHGAVPESAWITTCWTCVGWGSVQNVWCVPKHRRQGRCGGRGSAGMRANREVLISNTELETKFVWIRLSWRPCASWFELTNGRAFNDPCTVFGSRSALASLVIAWKEWFSTQTSNRTPASAVHMLSVRWSTDCSSNSRLASPLGGERESRLLLCSWGLPRRLLMVPRNAWVHVSWLYFWKVGTGEKSSFCKKSSESCKRALLQFSERVGTCHFRRFSRYPCISQ